MKNNTTTIYIDEETLTKAKTLAEKDRRSLSNFVRDLILKEWENNKENEK